MRGKYLAQKNWLSDQKQPNTIVIMFAAEPEFYYLAIAVKLVSGF